MEGSSRNKYEGHMYKAKEDQDRGWEVGGGDGWGEAGGSGGGKWSQLYLTNNKRRKIHK